MSARRFGGVVRLVDVVCSCSWSGRIGATARCPACRGNDHARMTTARAELLETIAGSRRNRMRERGPIGLLWAAKHGLVTPGPRRQARGDGSIKPAPRTYSLTERGRAALTAYRAIVPGRPIVCPPAITGREAILRRELAIDTAVRHADIPDGER